MVREMIRDKAWNHYWNFEVIASPNGEDSSNLDLTIKGMIRMQAARLQLQSTNRLRNQ